MTAILQEVRTTMRLAWPIAVAQFLWFSMTFVDNLVVGRLGVEPLAALSLGMSYHHWWFTAFLGVLAAVSPIVSQAYGAGDFRAVGAVVRQGLILNCVFSGGVVFAYLFSDALFSLLGQDPGLSKLAGEYLTALSWGVPALLGWVVLRQITEATSDPLPSLVIVGAGALLNIPLDYALVFGAFGYPGLGVRGAGYATAAIAWLIVVMVLIYVAWAPSYQRFEFFKARRLFDGALLREILRLGIPTAGSLMSELSLFVGATFIIGTFSALQLAAHQIALNLAALVFMIPLGLSFAVSIRVGQSTGRGDLQAARTCGSAGFLITAALQLTFAVLFVLCPEALAKLYTTDQEAIQVAVGFLYVAALFQLFDGIQVVGMGALRGLKDTRVPFYNNVLSYWLIGFLCIYLAAFYFDYGPLGVWFGLLAGLLCAALLHVSRFYRLSRSA